ncbi:MAG TPA: methylated-DNA--[protein]-cysteine S-methyltransferase [Rhizobiales bacterium]|nr:methylated-DNA--[protein]-cysteine S-methyltransferase [Hyphomicrobiales bacterium]
MTRQLDYTYYDSPIGPLLLAGTVRALHLVSFPTGSRTRQPQDGWRENAETFAPVIAQLGEYFAGTRQVFDLQLELVGTEFQKDVWRALAQIPFGETISYGEMARRVNRPKASRAVGAANGANNLPIILPCHRVIGANKTLTGFGGGLKTKEFLLRHEQAIAPPKGHQGALFA